MASHNNGVFSKSTTLISIILTILGLIGIIITPSNANFIIIGMGVVILLVILMDKFNQINENTENINKINEKLNIDARINSLEKEIYEQKGKLAMVVPKK